MNTKTIHQCLKFLAATAMVLSAHGAWAVCEDEHRAWLRASNLDEQSEPRVRDQMQYELQKMQAEAATASETQKKQALLANEQRSRDASLSPPNRTFSAITACLMRAVGISSTGSTSTSQSNASGGAKCDAARAAQGRDFDALKPLSQGTTPQLMRVMWMTSEAAKLLRNSCPSTPEFQKQIADYERSYREAETACNQLSSAKCVPNPYR